MKTLTTLTRFLLLFAVAMPAYAADEEDPSTTAEQEQENEKEDDAGGKFLVLPFFITEPAIGEGLGAGLVYFHANRDPDTPNFSSARSLNRADREQKPPPTADRCFRFLHE